MLPKAVSLHLLNHLYTAEFRALPMNKYMYIHCCRMVQAGIPTLHSKYKFTYGRLPDLSVTLLSVSRHEASDGRKHYGGRTVQGAL